MTEYGYLLWSAAIQILLRSCMNSKALLNNDHVDNKWLSKKIKPLVEQGAGGWARGQRQHFLGQSSHQSAWTLCHQVPATWQVESPSHCPGPLFQCYDLIDLSGITSRKITIIVHVANVFVFVVVLVVLCSISFFSITSSQVLLKSGSQWSPPPAKPDLHRSAYASKWFVIITTGLTLLSFSYIFWFKNFSEVSSEDHHW